MNEYLALINGVQALRRRMERLASPYQGASGVRAQLYPHQLQAVLRVLSDTRIRHLLADEVGLGKTVEALMIMNAVRLQRSGRLRVLILVPTYDRAKQWMDEIRGRVHTAPITNDEGDRRPNHPRQRLELLWPEEIDRVYAGSINSALDPNQFDLLIVDEVQMLSAPILDRLSRAAADFESLLVLTATPDLRTTRSICRLLQLIEPEWVELARRRMAEVRTREEMEADDSVGDDWARTPLANFPPEYQRDVLDRLHEKEQEILTEAEALTNVPLNGRTDFDLAQLTDNLETLSLASNIYRRVIRSRRLDYPRHLPQRHYTSQIIEPLECEERRQHLMLRFLQERMREGWPRDRAVLVARRVALGGESLRQRVLALRREAPAPVLDEVLEWTREDLGDSRLDELTDWLAQFWREHPQRKVILAVQDNPTVRVLKDRLSERLPQVGPPGERFDLEIIDMPDSQEEGHVNLVEAHHAAERTMARFQNGPAHLLIAHDNYGESFNLQMADALVFYSLPWRPEDVDQWIGRVDRLGRETIDLTKPWSPPRSVCLLTITQRNLMDDQVRRAVEQTEVFEHALSLDFNTEFIGQATEDIQDIGLGLRSVPEKPRTQQEEDPGGDQLEEEMMGFLPWLPDGAEAMFEQVRKEAPLEPVLRGKPLGYISHNKEAALGSWVRFLIKQGEYQIRSNQDPQQPEKRRLRYWTLACAHDAMGHLGRVLDELPKPRWIPFLLARAHIQQPPRKEVELQFDPAQYPGSRRMRELHFLDHGSRLHEALVKTWLQVWKNHPWPEMDVRLDRDQLPPDIDYSAFSDCCFIAVGTVDPAAPIRPCLNETGLLKDLEAAPNQTHQSMREREVRQLQSLVEADERFVRGLLPAQLLVETLQYDRAREAFVRCSDPAFGHSLLTPLHPDNNLWHVEVRGQLGLQYQPLQDECARHLVRRTIQTWQTRLEELNNKVAQRKVLITLEAQARLEIERLELARVGRMIELWRQQEGADAERVLQTTLMPRRALIMERMLLIERVTRMRLEGLEGVLKHAGQPKVKIKGGALLHLTIL